MSVANQVAEYLGKMQASIPHEHLEAVGAPLIERTHCIEAGIKSGTLAVSRSQPHLPSATKLYERPLLAKQLNRISEEKKQCEQELRQLNQEFSRFDQLEKELVHNRLEERRVSREMEQQRRKEMAEQAKNNIRQWHQQRNELL